jgi:hypothetical protein
MLFMRLCHQHCMWLHVCRQRWRFHGFFSLSDLCRLLPQHEDAASPCWGWYCSESLWITRVFEYDDQNPYELLWMLDMILASWKCWPQLLHPHAEDDNGHVEDEHPIHPLQGMSLDLCPTPHLFRNLPNLAHGHGLWAPHGIWVIHKAAGNYLTRSPGRGGTIQN